MTIGNTMTEEVTFQSNIDAASPAVDQPQETETPSTAPEVDLNTILKRMDDKDSFITKLQEENFQLREIRREYQELKERASTTDDVLNKLEEQSKSTIEAEKNKTTQLDKDELLNEVTNKVLSIQQEKELQDTYSRNWTEVTSRLTETFGDNTDAKVAEVAKEYGMSLEDAVRDAQMNPKRFLKMFDLDRKATPKASTGLSQGSLNANAIASTTGSKNREYYKSLRKTNPNLYWSADVQKEIMSSGVYKD